MSDLSVDQKLARVMLKLRSVAPFFSCIYEAIEKCESTEVDTMAVTTNKMLYNRKFVESVNFAQLMFVVLHELSHIALMHVARCENRDQLLWNVATDMYVNETLLNDFELCVGRAKSFPNGVEIEPLPGALYCSSLSLSDDYSEKIYESLDKQAKKNGYYKSKLSGGLGGSGESGGSGNFEFSYTGSNGSEKQAYVNINKCDSDLINTGEDQSIKNEQSRKVISDAVVRNQMSNRSAGSSTSNIERLVNKLLEVQIDWKRILKRYLIKSTSSDSSFSSPDKRLYYQNAIYPGQYKSENNQIKGVKVCVDVSGSISDEDLAYFYYEIIKLTTTYKVNAELIYWDSEVKSVGSFSNKTELNRINCYGGGGTDPSCVFSYFDNNKIKPVVTLMLTDGFFSVEKITSKQRKKYKNTIWILTEDHLDKFNPGFGTVAKLKFN